MLYRLLNRNLTLSLFVCFDKGCNNIYRKNIAFTTTNINNKYFNLKTQITSKTTKLN